MIRKGKNNSGAILIGRMPIMLRSDRCDACLNGCFMGGLPGSLLVLHGKPTACARPRLG